MAKPPLSQVLGQLRKIADQQRQQDATDGQLLEAFAARQEEPAFAALLRRHGAMVLSVCQRILGQEQEAEDVFQATFLLLARKASSIRKRESVGPWLHSVAHRLSLRAKAQNALRQARERKAIPQA